MYQYFAWGCYQWYWYIGGNNEEGLILQPLDTGVPTEQWPQTHIETVLKRLNQTNIKLLGWFSQSPDLNPVDTLWTMLKIWVCARKPTNSANKLTLRKKPPKQKHKKTQNTMTFMLMMTVWKPSDCNCM